MDHRSADRVVVDEGDVQRDVDLRDNERRRKEPCGPTLVDPDRVVELRTLETSRPAGVAEATEIDGGTTKIAIRTAVTRSAEFLILRILLLPIPSRDFRAIAKKSVPYLYVVHESIFTPWKCVTTRPLCMGEVAS